MTCRALLLVGAHSCRTERRRAPADGKIVVGGTSAAGGTVIRLNTDGALDSTFGTGGAAALASGSAIRRMTLEGASIVVGGNDGSCNGMLARLTSAGALDTTFGTASGYTTLAPPSGDAEHIDELFYDPTDVRRNAPQICLCHTGRGGSILDRCQGADSQTGRDNVSGR